jgi:hypothetical protein
MEPKTNVSHVQAGGSLSLGLSGAAVSAGVVAGGTAGTVAMLWPNTFAPDAAFYSTEEFANLVVANIGVRVNVKHLPDPEAAFLIACLGVAALVSMLRGLAICK